MRILVADDEPVFLCRRRAYLAEWGYEATGVRDGQKALEVLQSPDALQQAGSLPFSAKSPPRLS